MQFWGRSVYIIPTTGWRSMVATTPTRPKETFYYVNYAGSGIVRIS